MVWNSTPCETAHQPQIFGNVAHIYNTDVDDERRTTRSKRRRRAARLKTARHNSSRRATRFCRPRMSSYVVVVKRLPLIRLFVHHCALRFGALLTDGNALDARPHWTRHVETSRSCCEMCYEVARENATERRRERENEREIDRGWGVECGVCLTPFGGRRVGRDVGKDSIRAQSARSCDRYATPSIEWLLLHTYCVWARVYRNIFAYVEVIRMPR